MKLKINGRDQLLQQMRLTSDDVSTWPEWKVGCESQWKHLQEIRSMSTLPIAERIKLKKDLRSLIKKWVKNDINPRQTEIAAALQHAILELAEEENIDVDADWRLRRRKNETLS
jgi:hypothetical protein